MKTIIQIASNKYPANITLAYLSGPLFLGDDAPLQLFPLQQLLVELKDHPVGEEGHEGSSLLLMSQSSPFAPHPL